MSLFAQTVMQLEPGNEHSLHSVKENTVDCRSTSRSSILREGAVTEAEAVDAPGCDPGGRGCKSLRSPKS